MPDFIPPIVVDIISRSPGFKSGVDKAKADMADLSSAATATAAEADSAIAGADQSIGSHAEKIGSNMQGLGGDVAMGMGAIPAAAEDVVKGSEKVSEGAGKMERDVTEKAGKSGSSFKRFAGVVGNALNDLGVPIGAVSSKLGGVEKVAEETGGGLGGGLVTGATAGGVALAALGYESVKMGAAFQTTMTQLVTGAGESEKNIKGVGNGILAMSATVGQTPLELAKGMYLIESAGDHGAAGLTVLKSAAEGAATGGAQMSDVANVLTTAMHDYAIPTSRANAVTSALIETVALGKTHLSALSTAMASVMPVASSMGVSFQNVTGAMSTMTLAGMTARRAGTSLAFLLRSFGDPGAAAQKAMASVGISAQHLKDTMSKQGLGAALEYVQEMVGKKFPAGSVAATQAFSAIAGGATGYNTALMLTGKNAATFNQNSRQIGTVLDGSAKSVQGFGKASKDLAFQWAQFKDMIDAFVTKLGMGLIPLLEKAGGVVLPIVKEAIKGIVLVFGDLDAAWKFLGPFHDAILAAAAAFGILWLASLPIVATIAAAVWPFLAVIAAIVAVVEVVKHFQIVETVMKDVWGAVKSIVTGAVHAVASVISSVFGAIVSTIEGIWHAIEHGVSAAWDWIKGHLSVIVPIVVGIITGPIGLLVYELVRHWKAIEADIVSVWNSIKDFFTHTLGHIVGDVGRFVGGLVSTVWSAGEKVFSAALHFGEKLAEGILHGIESLPGAVLHVLEKIPIVGGVIKAGGKILGGLVSGVSAVFGASGGVAVKPTLMMVGEGSEPEAVLPLSQLRQLLSGHQGEFYPAQGAGASTQQAKGGLTIENLSIVGRSRTDAQIVNDLWLRLRPYLTAPAY